MKLIRKTLLLFSCVLLSNLSFAGSVIPDIVVDINGTGNFTSIQAAINAVPSNSTKETIIFVKRGLYDKEKLIIPADKPHIILIGESRTETIISYDIYNCNDGGDGLCPDAKVALWSSNSDLVATAGTLTIMANDFRAENITIRNTAGNVGQAQALTIRADRTVFVNCDITAYQDTIYFWMAETSRSYFTSCMILGRTDYIYGQGIAVFNECEIRSYGGAWITAPSSTIRQTYGFVFCKCNLTYQPNSPRSGDDGMKIKFGRPWHEYPKVAWLYCSMPAEIDPLGWGDKWNMDYSDTSTDLHLYEWMNSGPGADMSGRAKWAGLRPMMNQTEADLYEPKVVLAGTDNWDPTAIAPTVIVYNWDGGAATNAWLEANNWNPNGIPVLSEVANVDGNSTIDANGGSFAADLNMTNGATIKVSANSTTTLLTLNQSTIASSVNATLSGNIKTKGDLIINSTGNLNIMAAISGIHQITKTGTGILQLSGNNAGYTGNLVIEAGDLQAKTANSLGNATKITVKTGGKLSIDASDAIQTKTPLYTEGTALIVLNQDITISEWYIDGILKATGQYDATTNPGTISGTGKIIIGRPSQFIFNGGSTNSNWDNPSYYTPALLPEKGEKVIVSSRFIEAVSSVFQGDMYLSNGAYILLRRTSVSQCLGPVRMEQGTSLNYATSGTGFYLNAPIILLGDITLLMSSTNTAGSIMDLPGTFSGNYKIKVINNRSGSINTATVKLGGDNSNFNGIWDLTIAATTSGGSTAIEGTVENAFGSGTINVDKNNKVIFSHERAAGSELKLNLAGSGKAVLNTTVKLQKMTVNGVSFGNGTYDKTTHPDFFTGIGKIEIIGNCSADVTTSPISSAANATEVQVGGTLQLSHQITGGTWTSSAPTKASITANGLVSGLAPGTIKITYSLCDKSVTKDIVIVAVDLDDDKDGVTNSKDLCPNTPVGSTVDANGCFTLPSDNFSIEAGGESCVGKKNGKITITAVKSLNYSVVINGVTYTFNTTETIENLAPGVYDFCITVASDSFSRCFSATVASGTNVSAKTTMISDKLSVDIEQGTAPYTVSVNGKNVLETSASSFSVGVNPGDEVQVKTALACEGTINSKIALEPIVAFPNPTKGFFEITVPIALENVKVEMLNVNSQILSSDTYKVTNGKVALNIENRASAVYFVKVYLDENVIIKIIKQ
nr:pectinesterase family protein [uncultured Flavobacterium sp.]